MPIQTDEGDLLFELLFDSARPVPNPIDLPKMAWAGVQEILLDRVSRVLDKIVNHATNSKRRWLRLGGPGGIISMLRAVEFARRLGTGGCCPNSVERVTALIQDIERILAQEAWRRWALKSFTQSDHGRAGDLVVIWELMMEVECRASCEAHEVGIVSRVTI